MKKLTKTQLNYLNKLKVELALCYYHQTSMFPHRKWIERVKELEEKIKELENQGKGIKNEY